jgi:O-6-methylguanine DNA methyltransferase
VALGPKGIERITLPVNSQRTGEPQPLQGYVLGRDESVAAAIQAWCDGDASEAQSAISELTPHLPASLLPDFYSEVLETLAREVQWGEVVTYGELAALSGNPRAARAVGAAMAINPIPFVIPCHRVARSAGNGRRSLGGYGGGHDENYLYIKRILLAREGVVLPE